MRIFLLDKSYSGEEIYPLKKREIQYLEKVLRMEDGITFTAKDSTENYYTATLLKGGLLSLSPTTSPEDTLWDTLSAYKGVFAPIDMYVSVLKGKKNETVVRALTEIGARRIIFVRTKFCQENELSSHQMDRLGIIIKEAVQQCGGRLPSLEGPINFDKAIRNAEGKILILHQSLRKNTLSLKDINLGDSITSCFVGPEGGFSDEECTQAEEIGAFPILLKTNILRAETASIYVASAIQTLIH